MRSTLILLATLTLPGLLHAETPRKLDFTQVVMTLDGKPLRASAEPNAQELTLGDICMVALETLTDSDRGMSGADKFKLDTLARSVYKHKDVVLSAEDIATLKDRIGKVYGPAVVGATWPLLDPAEAK